MKTSTKLIILSVILILAFIISISVGSVKVPIADIIKILIGQGEDSVTKDLIREIRLPRALSTVVAGAALAVSGLMLQIFFDNPIVEPYVLGISSGSMIFLSFVILGGQRLGITKLPPTIMFLGSLVGALVVTSIVIFMSMKVKSVVTLLIIGLMSGYLFSAITSILIAFANVDQIGTFAVATMGSFAGFDWTRLKVVAITTLVFSSLAYLMSKPLNVMLLGEGYGTSVGINIKRFRIAVVLISSALTAVVTAFAGPVSFIGLSVPHIVRLGLKTSDNRVVIPGVILGGAALTSICDTLARTIAAPYELPIGAITAIIGVPLVIYILISNEKT